MAHIEKLSHPYLDLKRAIEAQVIRKVARDKWNVFRFGEDAPLSDMAIFPAASEVTQSLAGKSIVTRRRRQISGKVLGGSWDKERRDLVGNTKLESCRMRWVDGADWEETPQFQSMARKIAEGEQPDDCRSLADLRSRYARLDIIFAEARHRGRLLRMSELPDYRYRREHGATLIHVGHDGACLRHGGGAHRFAIAKILDLPEIPAQLGAIHPQAIRDGHLARLRVSRFDS
ncbi:hypothetical protein GGQ68_002682 [Sagittula marina]|uniref:Uncharacterized protein n=1 Tax=Sagittula marina TaxID=943940 RepID=A0A7W6GT94_9RHOB|nr:hypothetical protein [Sagittula marina]MBB3986343.1 hypothetical protein [Sagittula marina]